ncbi:MAG: hypothetical protein M3O80_04120 [Chloroflexota bacterium]|nr:hypothetical protein [Chloroflexota bacterium]
MKVAEPAATSQVFVPTIGFRPATTRALVERAEVTEDGTRLIVRAVAAAPDKTEVLVEWERTVNPAIYAPGSQLLVHSNMAPLERGIAAALVVGATTLTAITMAQRAFHVSQQTIGAIHTITFAPLPEGVGDAALVVSENGEQWRVPLKLGPPDVAATPLAANVELDRIVIRTTAIARHEGDLIIQLEVVGERQILQVGAPLPSGGVRFSVDSEEDRRARRASIRQVMGGRERPITLEGDRGVRHEEIRRMFDLEGQQAGPGQPFINRFAVVFEGPVATARSATLVVPFVDMSDPDGSVTADLRQVPLDVKVGSHLFHIQSAELIAHDRRRVIVEAKPSPWPPRFRHPAMMRGADPTESSWPNGGPGEQLMFDAAVGDPPIVTFKGTVFRVDGPMRLEIPLV